MEPGHKCVVEQSPEGVISVDGRPYPMASAVVATEDVIQASIKRIAKQIAEEYKSLMHADVTKGGDETPISYDNPLIILSVLKGSYIFTADFVRYLGDYGLPHVVDFIRLTSYREGTKSSGVVTVLSQPKFTNFNGKHILIVEDLCDSGRTLKFLKEHLDAQYKPKTVKTLVLVDKSSDARKVEFHTDYKCLPAPNKYIIGYGFEVNDRYRDFRHVFVLKDGEEAKYKAKL